VFIVPTTKGNMELLKNVVAVNWRPHSLKIPQNRHVLTIMALFSFFSLKPYCVVYANRYSPIAHHLSRKVRIRQAKDTDMIKSRITTDLLYQSRLLLPAFNLAFRPMRMFKLIKKRLTSWHSCLPTRITKLRTFNKELVISSYLFLKTNFR
jgi:hypothetical protein